MAGTDARRINGGWMYEVEQSIESLDKCIVLSSLLYY